MKLLIFDTETTGLPKTRQPAEKGPNNWPHLVSISWIVLDTDTNKEIKISSYIIRPNGWEIPKESSDIHGITEADAMKNGVNLMDVLIEFINEPCDAWVAHNLEFDMGVIVNAVLWDIRMQFPTIPRKKFCTMLIGKNLCKLPGKFNNSYKAPKLKELYYQAFGRFPDELKLHNSMYDVRILTEIIKSYLPLRQAMGLVARSIPKSDESRTLTICIKHAEGDDPDMG